MAVFAGQDIQCIRGERLVLENARFEVADGCALVLTGRNGAGKSTLLRLMAGLMRPVQGRLTWDGEDIAIDPGRHNGRIAYVGHADAVQPALSVIENVGFWAALSGAGGQAPTEALDVVGLGHLADLPARYLSAGQRRRVALIRALCSPATLWLLDEPATGLDARAQAMLSDLIAGHRKDGGMVCVSTHADLGLDGADGLDLGETAA